MLEWRGHLWRWKLRRGGIEALTLSAAGLFLLGQLQGWMVPCARAENQAPLTSLAKVRSLSLQTGAKGLPVHVQGVVTYSDPEWGVIFMQDRGAPVFVEYAPVKDDPIYPLQPGQVVEVEGVTTRGNVHCNVKGQHLRVVGSEPMPAAAELQSGGELTDKIEGYRVRVSGWVAMVGNLGERFTLELVVQPGKAISVVIPNLDAATAESLRGWQIEATGVAALKFSGAKVTGEYLLFAHDMREIRKLRSLPVVQMEELENRRFQLPPNEPVRVTGTVANGSPGRILLLAEGRNSLRVQLSKPTNIAPETRVEVFAFPAYRQKSLVLTNAIVKQVSLERSAPKLPTPGGADTNLPEQTLVVQIRNLSPKEAAKGYPVRIVGVVTFCGLSGFEQFVQDDSGGIYVDRTRCKDNVPLAAGQRVEISGFSGPGEYAPVIHAEHVRLLGKSSFPQSHATTVPMMMTGAEDSQWVSLRGVVRSRAVEARQPVLVLATGDGLIKARLSGPGQTPAPADYIDAEVEVLGVCKTVFNEHRRLESVELRVPDWTQIDVKESPPENPFQLAVRPIDELSQFHSRSSGLHRVRLEGRVILRQADGTFFLEDESGGIRVQPKDLAAGIPPNEWTEVVGFPAVIDGLPVLQDASSKALTNREPIAAMPLTVESPINAELHATLVWLEGRVLSYSAGRREERLTVQFGSGVTDALLEKTAKGESLNRIQPGSVVRLTGVYLARLDETRKAQSFQLLLRSPKDVRVLSRPSWWTSRRTFSVLGGAAAVLLLAVAWIGLLRARVGQRTRELRAEIDERKRTEAKLEAEIAERKLMQEQVEQTHKQLLLVSRQAGMAEVATTVLHNVGNVLNSANVSAGLVLDHIRNSKASNVSRLAALLRAHGADLGEFLTRDSRGRRVPDFLSELGQHLDGEQKTLLKELKSLTANIDHIKEIVAMQRDYAKVVVLTEQVQVTDLVEDAIRMNDGDWSRQGIELVREFEPGLAPITVDKHKLLQILINLISNATAACAEVKRPDKRILVRVRRRLEPAQAPAVDHSTKAGADLPPGEEKILVSVEDNGVGIPSENLIAIFTQGFTTRRNGHGFGLHSGALAAKQLGGKLQAQSDGVDRGAAFTLELPITPPHG
jgi:signal transduction histidine kinase